MDKQIVERRIETIIAQWAALSLRQPARSNWLPSIECDHIDSVCLSCASREELATSPVPQTRTQQCADREVIAWAGECERVV
jgi:hypothetical protein